jgi:protoporphyrinogen oxidase
MKKKFVIIGAGLSGLSAGYQLNKFKINDWLIVEKNKYPGGLSASFRDKKGFVWDLGGHVFFSRYKNATSIFKKILKNDFLMHTRKAFVQIDKSLVPYPFQQNLSYLPEEKATKSLMSFLKARKKGKKVNNFKDWLHVTFGKEIANLFLVPHNQKLWCYPLKKMDFKWAKNSINIPKLNEIKQKRKKEEWGPNYRFYYPETGGIGQIAVSLAKYLNKNILFSKEVIFINSKEKKIILANGQQIKYDFLINTSPLIELVKNSDLKTKLKVYKCLFHNSLYILGLGLLGKPPFEFSWIYFPQKKFPFYRLSLTSKYSPNNTPTKNVFSLLAETTYSRYRPLKPDIEASVLKTLREIGMIKKGQKIISKFSRRVNYAYPVPSLGRDEVLSEIIKTLKKRNIFSMGRFGNWRYEEGSMDQALANGQNIIKTALI